MAPSSSQVLKVVSIRVKDVCLMPSGKAVVAGTCVQGCTTPIIAACGAGGRVRIISSTSSSMFAVLLPHARAIVGQLHGRIEQLYMAVTASVREQTTFQGDSTSRLSMTGASKPQC